MPAPAPRRIWCSPLPETNGAKWVAGLFGGGTHKIAVPLWLTSRQTFGTQKQTSQVHECGSLFLEGATFWGWEVKGEAPAFPLDMQTGLRVD